MQVRIGSDGKKYALASDGKYYAAPEESGSIPQQEMRYDPAAEKRKIMKNLAKDQSFGETMLIGSGRELDKMGSGIADLWDRGMSSFGSQESIDEANQSRADRKKEQKQKDDAYKYLSSESPVATTIGEIAPYLATLPAGLVGTGARTATHLAPKLGLEAAKRLAAETAIGAGQGAAHYDDTALSGAAWGAGGHIAGKWLGNLMGGGKNMLRGDDQKVIDFAKEHNLFVPPGMASGSKPLQQVDSAMRINPRTADKIDNRMDLSNRSQNNLIAKEIGGDKADYLTDSYMDTQRSRIGKDLDKAVENTSGEVTENMAYNASDIIQKFNNTSLTGKTPHILRRAEADLYKLADEGGLTGSKYQDTVRSLRQQATNQLTSPSGDRLLGKTLNDIINIYDDAIGGSSKQFAKSRRQWALLNEVDKVRDTTGNVDIPMLARKFKSSDTINSLSDVAKLRNKQQSSSLSTSGLVAKAIGNAAYSPAESLGALTLLSGKPFGGMMGIQDTLTDIYLSGYPHVSGIAPILGKNTSTGIERLLSRGAMLNDSNSDD